MFCALSLSLVCSSGSYLHLDAGHSLIMVWRKHHLDSPSGARCWISPFPWAFSTVCTLLPFSSKSSGKFRPHFCTYVCGVSFAHSDDDSFHWVLRTRVAFFLLLFSSKKEKKRTLFSSILIAQMKAWWGCFATRQKFVPFLSVMRQKH